MQNDSFISAGLLYINIVIWDQKTFITVMVGQEVEERQQNNGLINYILWFVFSEMNRQTLQFVHQRCLFLCVLGTLDCNMGCSGNQQRGG